MWKRQLDDIIDNDDHQFINNTNNNKNNCCDDIDGSNDYEQSKKKLKINNNNNNNCDNNHQSSYYDDTILASSDTTTTTTTTLNNINNTNNSNNNNTNTINNNNNTVIMILIDNDIHIKSNVFNLLKSKFKNQQLGKKLWLQNRELTHYQYIPIEFSKDEYFVTNFINRMNQKEYKYFKEKWYATDYTNILSGKLKKKYKDAIVLNSEIYESFTFDNTPSISLVNKINRICSESETQCIEMISRIATQVNDIDNFIDRHKNQFPFISKLLNNENELLFKCISYNYKVYKFIKYYQFLFNEEEEEHLEFLFKCVNANANILKFIDSKSSIFNKKPLIIKLFKSMNNNIKIEGGGDDIINKLSYKLLNHNKLFNDRKFALLAIEKGFNVLQYITSDELLNDREIVLNCVRNDGSALTGASVELQQDLELIFIAIKTNAEILNIVSNELLNDREFIFKCVKINGKCIKYIPQQFTSDIEIISEAIKQNPLNIKYIDISHDEMINNYKNAILNSIDIMNFEYSATSDGIFFINIIQNFKDLDFIIKLIETIPFSIHFINEKFRTNNKELIYKSTLLHSGYWMKFSEDAFQERINHTYYSAKIDSTGDGGDGGNEINYYRNLNKEHLKDLEWKRWNWW